jgi:hypothetical protein
VELEKRHQATLFYGGRPYTVSELCVNPVDAKRQIETLLDNPKIRRDLIDASLISVMIVDVYVPILQ